MALDFFAGCLGGCAGVVVGYPLDTIKVHIQTQDHRNPKYKGTWHCFRTLVAKESVAGLYRGMSSPMAGVAVVNAIVFGVYGQTQKLLDDSGGGNVNNGSINPNGALSSHFMAGVSAGIAQSPVCSPIELAKTRLQLQESKNHISGPLQCLRHIYKTEGLRGIFSGFGVTLLREAPSYGVYFFTYEALTRSDHPISTWHMLLAGGLAGTASWVASYPVDVVKSRLQADESSKYSGAIDCFRKSVRSEGWSCMFRGLSSTIIRAFPTNAATFAVVTWTMRLLGQDESYLRTQEVASLKKAAEVHDVKRTSYWDKLDQYGEAGCQALLEGATGDYMRQLLHTSLVMMPGNERVPIQNMKSGSGCHFDEVRHFEWVGEMICS
ncbi:hypothetical protein QAD02_001092 [Eretmocerus hayati]|uniref:Uncharacterized protein n=1 Tax=Eretmocerus hayati TaxID=131215 RepID=A0ACC2NF88_9HYME|nr:hypothetical protein QAD02_001092 [Eretmocerus hayati]